MFSDRFPLCISSHLTVLPLQGREILQKTVDLAEDTISGRVIYGLAEATSVVLVFMLSFTGDTDSIMINTKSTDLNEVKTMGEKARMR